MKKADLNEKYAVESATSSSHCEAKPITASTRPKYLRGPFPAAQISVLPPLKCPPPATRC